MKHKVAMLKPIWPSLNHGKHISLTVLQYENGFPRTILLNKWGIRVYILYAEIRSDNRYLIMFDPPYESQLLSNLE